MWEKHFLISIYENSFENFEISMRKNTKNPLRKNSEGKWRKRQKNAFPYPDTDLTSDLMIFT